MIRFVLTIAGIILSTFTIFAQDGHYWTQQYGTRSMLLSGSVIGGVEDLGAVYYNPARLGQIENPAFLLSADVYELTRIRIENAFGQSADAAKKDFGGLPSLAAGTFKVSFLPKHHFAWAVLLRANMNLNFNYRNEVYDDVIANFPGEEYFGAELSISSKIREEWAGLNWAYPITERLSVGASGFFSRSALSKGSSINLQALTESDQVAVYRFNRAYSFTQSSLLFKVGLSYKFNSGLIGFTFLTPKVKLKGNGSYKNEYFFAGIEGLSVNPDIYISNYQNKLDAQYKSPWAMGGGLTLFIKKSKIHLSSEWYNNIAKYSLMKSEDYYSQSTGDTMNFNLVDRLSGVLNFGTGVELYLSEKLSIYGSFSTDFSAVKSDINRFVQNLPETSNSVFRSDIYHFGAGFVLKLTGADITLGLTNMQLKQDFPRPFNFPEEEDDNIFDPDKSAIMRMERWRFVFSFSVPFLKDVKKKMEDKIGK